MLGYSAVHKGQQLLKCFVDLTKAYDRVDRPILWALLRRYGIPENIVVLIEQLHTGAFATVRVDGVTTTEPFELQRGLKQGSVFAPMLFNIFFGAIMNSCRSLFQERRCGGVEMLYRPQGLVLSQSTEYFEGKLYLTDIAFADDVEFFATSVEKMQTMLDIFGEVTSCFGQEISIDKSKIVCMVTTDPPVTEGGGGAVQAPPSSLPHPSLIRITVRGWLSRWWTSSSTWDAGRMIGVICRPSSRFAWVP